MQLSCHSKLILTTVRAKQWAACTSAQRVMLEREWRGIENTFNMFNMHRKMGTQQQQQHPPEMKPKFTNFFLLFFCYLISFVRWVIFSFFFLSRLTRRVNENGSMGYDIFLNSFFFSSTALAVAAIFIMAKWSVLQHFHLLFFVFHLFLLLMCPRPNTYNTALSSTIIPYLFPFDPTDAVIRIVGEYKMRELNLLFIFLFRLSSLQSSFFLVWLTRLNERSSKLNVYGTHTQQSWHIEMIENFVWLWSVTWSPHKEKEEK